MRPICRLVFGLLFAMPVSPALGAAPFAIAPPPAWVVSAAIEVGTRQGAATGGDVEYLLVDDQVRAAHPVEHHRHVAMRVTAPSGIAHASELRIDFDPSYQQLVIHGAWVIRGGRRVPVLRPRDVRIIQREAELDRRLFDGTLTAVAFLPDVRDGDVVEYAYTLRGENPVLAGRYAGSFSLGYAEPVGRLRVRLVWPAGRSLHHRVRGIDLAPAVTTRGGETELLWERVAVPGTAGEDRTPAGVSAWPELEVSEYAGWSDVVRWALPLYADAPLSPAMRAKAAEWQRLPGDEVRARAALRFTQDEVRYLGIEMGERSHRPHPPGEVFARRFGDCKDKAFLLVTLLRAMGIQAEPALVSTEDRESAASRLPSPFAFDHVIVRATVDGRTRWLEPTRALEHSPVDGLISPAYGRALPVRAGQEDLEALPTPTPSVADAVATYRVGRYGESVSLEVRSRYEGFRALDLRRWLAADGAEAVQRSYLDHYARAFVGIQADGPLVVEDAADAERVIVRERYRLPPVGPDSEQPFLADLLREELEVPRTVLRKLPLGVRHPVSIRETVRIELPGVPEDVPEDDVEVTPGARFSRTVRREGQRLEAVFEYRSLADRVSAAEVPKHLQALQRMRQYSGFTAGLSVRAPADGQAGDSGTTWLAPALVVLALVSVGVISVGRTDLRASWASLRQWRRKRSFAAKFVGRPGDSPALPLVAGTLEQATARAARLRCACGARIGPLPAERSEVLFDGHVLQVAVVPCPRCGESRRVYLAAPS